MKGTKSPNMAHSKYDRKLNKFDEFLVSCQKINS